MKILRVIFLISQIFLFSSSFAQNACTSSLPFCASQSAVSFPAGVNNGSAAAGPDYGCLVDQPNPAWYYFQVSQAGNIIIDIEGTGGEDVDFICYGPFSSPTGNCTNLTAGNTIDCSFDPSPTETCTINNAQVGQYYTLLITNYSNQPQNIDFNQTGGTGSTNCGLLTSGVTSQTTCAGAPTVLTVNSNVINPTYVWTPGGATTQTISVSPASTTVYSVSISGTNASGTPTTIVNTGTVTVNSLPVVNATSNSPVCPGSTLNLSVTAGSTYTWTGPGSFSSAIQAPSIANVSAGNAGVYSVTVTNAAGCKGTSTVNVTLGSASSPTLESNGPLCSGSTLSLTATSGATSYTWTGPGGFNSTNQNPVIPSVTSSGVYTLTTAGVPCLSINTISVTVVTVSSVTLSSNSPICSGATLSLTAGGSPSTYTWTGPGGFMSNNQNPVVPSVTSSGVYTLTAGSGICVTTNTISVSIVSFVFIPLTPISTVCNNGNINLSAPGGGSSYSWSGPNNYNSTAQNPLIPNAGVINKGLYTVTILTGGCMSTGTVNVDVYNALGFGSLPTDITICKGKTGALNSIGGTGGSGSYNYNWTPSIGLSSFDTPSTTVTTTVTTTYTLTIADANCPVTLNVSAQATASVNPTPVITFTTSNAKGCEPFCTDLSSTSVPASARCEWKFTNNLGTSNCNEGTFCFPTHGVYNASLTVTDINGCVDSVSQNAFVLVDPKPIPSFDWFPGNPTILVNEISFTDHSTVGLPIQSWNWTFGDYFLPFSQDTSSSQNPIHLYNNVGTYTVSLEVTNSFGCKEIITKIIDIQDELAVYIPNAFTPSRQEGKNDVFNIQGMGFLSDGFEMTIYDRWGHIVFKTNDVYKGWDGSTKGGAKAEQGVYVYKIKLTDFKLHEKEYVGHVTLF